MELWAFPVLQDITCNVDIAGPSAPLGNALMGMLTWGYAVPSILAVDGCSVNNCTGSPEVWKWSLLALLDLGNHCTGHSFNKFLPFF